MQITIKNAEAAYINPASQSNRLNVDIAGVEPEDILFQVDIDQAIRYYGITELLDTIGDKEIRSHLSELEEFNQTAVETSQLTSEAKRLQKIK